MADVVNRLLAAGDALELLGWAGTAYAIRDVASQLTPGHGRSDDGAEVAAAAVESALAAPPVLDQYGDPVVPASEAQLRHAGETLQKIAGGAYGDLRGQAQSIHDVAAWLTGSKGAPGTDWPIRAHADIPPPTGDQRPARELLNQLAMVAGWRGAHDVGFIRHVAHLRKGDRPARRGDVVEAWIKRQRDLYSHGDTHWSTLDDLLDTWRLHADTGTPLTETAHEGPGA